MEKEKTEDQSISSTEPLAEKNETTETDAPSDEKNLKEKTPEDLHGRGGVGDEYSELVLGDVGILFFLS